MARTTTSPPTTENVKMTRYTPDPENAREHPERNKTLIRQSLEEIGAGRSILISGDNTIIAGNGVYEQAQKLGLTIREVEAGPDELIAVKRNDLTGERAIRAAILDNATGDSSTWDMEALRQLDAAYPDLLAGLDEVQAELSAALEAMLPEAGDAGSVEDIEPDEAGDVPDLVAPFPWFGGKARVASRIWARFGDVQNYVEPFCGSAAVLLAAPEPPKIATLNDADGFVANFWRALIAEPDAVAQHLDWPVNEIDLFARHVWLVKRSGELRTRLEAEPDYYDAKIAGWWCWGACAWIGTGWCSGEGPWSVGDDGQQVNIRGNAGQGVNRKLPHLGDAGQGVNRKLPHLGDAGKGVNRQLPHLGDAGKGVNRKLPHLGDAGKGVCERITEHLHAYMHRLADALRTARVTCGDWSRIVTPSCTTRHGITAVLLDPPYGEGEMEYSAEGNQDKDVAEAVWRWACENGDDPLLRIAVCGYEDGRTVPPGWSVLRWTARKGYASTEEARENSRRECIWFSPHCENIDSHGI